MAKNLTIEINTTNLGPHMSLNARLQTSNLEIGIYANNGLGKSFLSRAFRLATKKDLLPEDSNRLLTIGEDKGAFKLKIINTHEPGVIRELELNLNRDTLPVISKNTTGYLFRVFNDDYVRENLEISKYRPDGKIEGYILGKEKIDLSKEKDDLEKAKLELESKEQELKVKVAAAIAELDNLSIRKNTSEYQNVSYNNLFNPDFTVTEQESFNDLVKKHNQLKSLPDNLQDLENVELIKQTDTLLKIVDFLKGQFSKSSIAEDFKLKVKQKQDFIETGVTLIDKSKNECPFCEQELKETALKLIDQYQEYLSETEAQQIKKASELIIQLTNEKKTFSDTYKTSVKLHSDYLKYQRFIPSLGETYLCELNDVKELENDCKVLKQALDKKKEDITVSIATTEINDAVEHIKQWLINSNQCIQNNAPIIETFNDRKNNTNAERLELNRRLCRARFLELKQVQNSLIKKIEDLRTSIQELKSIILEKEQSEKILKRQKVVDTFKKLLSNFFRTKYSLDETTFCLKFQNHLLEANASDVLSSGEKSIVAFCYYIAETHKFIEKEEDYEKLFFIIDDPISSLDFHFVYATSQTIRTLNKWFNIPRLRLMLLTHNLEFMSIVIRNKIIEQKFVLSNGQIDGLRSELIMPYEEHLRDIYAVSTGIKTPCHTTPNSLRHILETINRFVAPDIDLSSFCEKIEGYADNEFLYSLIHDASHGGIRLQKAYTDEMIKAACDVVIKHISSKFEGQIKLIQS